MPHDLADGVEGELGEVYFIQLDPFEGLDVVGWLDGYIVGEGANKAEVCGLVGDAFVEIVGVGCGAKVRELRGINAEFFFDFSGNGLFCGFAGVHKSAG